MTEQSERFAYYRGGKAPSFATETECEAARILDFYRVPWCYEPRTFVLEEDSEGQIIEAFTPDFYLPDLDMYIEVTQMKQSLVTAKNRKVRKLRERYPQVKVKLLYKNDFAKLAKKFADDAARVVSVAGRVQPAPRFPAVPVPDRSLLGDVFLTRGELAARVAELADQIDRDYQGRELLLVTVLKGALFFLVDLARALRTPLELDFLAITGYVQLRQDGGSPETRRTVRFVKDLDRPIEGRHVLLVEDIVDTGLTLHYIRRALALRDPASLEVCTLLDRPYRRLVDIPVRYTGFTVPDDFFVGYGFDYQQLYRNLPYIAYLNL